MGQCQGLPSVPGSVQLYDVHRDELRQTVALLNYPLISRAQEKRPERYCADFVSFSRDGSRMATAVRRECDAPILGSGGGGGGGEGSQLVTLQFWDLADCQNPGFKVQSSKFKVQT